MQNDCLLICSASNLNYQAIWWTKLWRKKVFYLMHGLESYETNIENETPKAGTLKYEKFIFHMLIKLYVYLNLLKKLLLIWLKKNINLNLRTFIILFPVKKERNQINKSMNFIQYY